jgi:BASS family bile acid:Na+ symporter
MRNSRMIGALISATVFYLLLVVGAKLTIADFRLILRYPVVITSITLAHLILVPAVVIAIVSTIELDPWIAMGMILIAASPTGAMSNYYVTLARGSAAISVTLCGVTSILSFLTAPLSCWLIGKFLSIDAVAAVPFTSMIKQTIPIVLIPIIVGMGIRQLWPSWVERHYPSADRMSFFAILLLIGVILTLQFNYLTPAILVSAILMAIVFTIILSVMGWTVARLMAPSLNKSQWSGIMFGFPARNLGLATLLAANVFGVIEMAAFGLVFFIIQILILLPLGFALRRMNLPQLNRFTNERQSS